MAREPETPLLSVDMIIHTSPTSILLIKRKDPPRGSALPGGFVERGEDLEDAAKREAMEETGCRFHILQQFRAYGSPERDPRFHTCSIVYIGTTRDTPKAGDDAKEVRNFSISNPIPELQFDHGIILNDYLRDCYPQIKSKLT